jgi:ribosomal protein S24E
LEIRIIDQRANPLLHRLEYRFEVAHAMASTPKREEVRSELAKLVHAPKDRVIVERMHARFGTAVSRGDANVYETVDALQKITREHILVRHGLKEKASKTPAPAESPAAEAPKAEAPKPETPKTEAPKADEPKPEAHKAEHHKPEAAKAEGHKPEGPKGEGHKAEGHRSEESKGEASKPEGHKPRTGKSGESHTAEASGDAKE